MTIVDVKIPMELHLAAIAAKRSDHEIYKVGAAIFKKGRLITYGWNKNKTHPRSRNYTRKIHAELDALIGWRNTTNLYKTDMFVARVTVAGTMATSKPCEYCMILIKEAGIKSVTFIDEQGKICTLKL